MKIRAHIVEKEAGETNRQFAQACAIHARLERVPVEAFAGQCHLGTVDFTCDSATAYERLFHQPAARVHELLREGVR